VLRRVQATSPPGVEYRLTALGQSILVPLRHMLDWANANFPAIRAARVAFLADPPADETSGRASRPASCIVFWTADLQTIANRSPP
jgi:hypothetical protein